MAWLLLDGIDVAARCCVVALAIGADGRKVPVGRWEGSTEHATVVRHLLADLHGRGLDASGGLLVVIDGAKALATAVRSVFGALALVQRCTVHQRRNVTEHLPQATAAGWTPGSPRNDSASHASQVASRAAARQSPACRYSAYARSRPRRWLPPRPATRRKMVEFLQAVGIQGASVLEIGGGVGEVEIQLLKAGAARARNLELSPAYEREARTLAGQAGVQGRIDWRIHDLAEDPEAVEPADLVVLHRVVCCYPDYRRLLGAAADRAQRALVFSYPPRNALSRAFYGVFNLVMRLTQTSFRGLPTRRAGCLRCWRTTGFGGPTSAAAESGRSLAWSGFRKARPRPT